jgi:hypothetical protein
MRSAVRNAAPVTAERNRSAPVYRQYGRRASPWPVPVACTAPRRGCCRPTREAASYADAGLFSRARRPPCRGVSHDQGCEVLAPVSEEQGDNAAPFKALGFGRRWPIWTNGQLTPSLRASLLTGRDRLATTAVSTATETNAQLVPPTASTRFSSSWGRGRGQLDVGSGSAE